MNKELEATLIEYAAMLTDAETLRQRAQKLRENSADFDRLVSAMEAQRTGSFWQTEEARRSAA